jgi:hypothetical protein
MEQDVLSHRKAIKEECIEMENILEEPSLMPGASDCNSAAVASGKIDTKEAMTGIDKNAELHDTRTKKQKATERTHFAALCWCIFLAGWNDGTTGPLLPRIQQVYHVCSYLLRSLPSYQPSMNSLSG